MVPEPPPASRKVLRVPRGFSPMVRPTDYPQFVENRFTTTPGPFDLHYWDTLFENKRNSKAPIMSPLHQPEHVPGRDWWTHPAPTGRLFAFHNANFSGQDDAYVWNVKEWLTGGIEAPAKWWAHTHLHADFWFDDCHGDICEEHVFYLKNCRKLQINDCNNFGRQGGTWLQVASRRGRQDIPGYSKGYTHGNPLHRPAGQDGWCLINRCKIDGLNIWERKASELTWAGFLGPISVHDVEIRDSYSGIAVWADTFKGAHLVGGGHFTDGDGTEPYNHDKICPYFQGDEILIDGRGNDNREQIMLSGVGEIHLGRFSVTGSKPAVVLGSRWGGPFSNGKVAFYDQESVQNHLGRIGYHKFDLPTAERMKLYGPYAGVNAAQSSRPSWESVYDDSIDKTAGKFVAYTEEELQEMMV